MPVRSPRNTSLTPAPHRSGRTWSSEHNGNVAIRRTLKPGSRGTDHNLVPPRNRLLRAVALIALLAVALLLPSLAYAPPASAAGTISETMERDFASLINQERAARGLATLGVSLSIRDVARTWSGTMAGSDSLYHNPNIVSQIGQIDDRWRSLGENVGVGYSVSSLHQALMNSAGHRANILGNWTYMTIGVVVMGDGKIWLTQNFIRTPTAHALVSAAMPPAAPPVSESVWYMRNVAGSGRPDKSLAYGVTGYQQLSCDWDGNGSDTIGVYAGNTFYLRNDNAAGAADLVIPFGWGGVTAVCGDWNGDGTDTIGIYAGGQWYLRDSNTPGTADYIFSYGWSAASPVVGDWNGDETDGIGVVSNGSWYLRPTPSAGPANVALAYGYSGVIPVTGDWDGDGDDSIGVFDRGSWYLRQDTAPGRPDVAFDYGWTSTRPVSGDWDGDGTTGVAVVPA